MQKSILEFAREQADEFLKCPVVPTFFTGTSAPDLTTTNYTTRFTYIVWTKLLHFMREYLPNVTGSPTLTFRQEWDSMADTLRTLSELPGHLCRIIANAKDPAAKAMVASALQEALATIRKPVRGQGASETVKSDSATYSTGTSLEAASELLPTIEIMSRRDDQTPITGQSPADRSVSSSCKMTTSMPRQNARGSADETDDTGFYRDWSRSPALDDSHGMESLREPSSLDPALWPDQPTKDCEDMPPVPAEAKVSTASPTSKSLPQPKMSQDSAVRRGNSKTKLSLSKPYYNVHARMSKTKNHLGGGKGVASDQGASFGPAPPSQGFKARFQNLPKSK
ncbi:hypothetical protein E4U48_007911 [Claviceps purpurea]|nr:hypothetical protein E4U25_007097 [Claviceps purpurea]KAG6261178.1 hypothetical protein E4U48_007911 [Claviceps purpurea]